MSRNRREDRTIRETRGLASPCLQWRLTRHRVPRGVRPRRPRRPHRRDGAGLDRVLRPAASGVDEGRAARLGRATGLHPHSRGEPGTQPRRAGARRPQRVLHDRHARSSGHAYHRDPAAGQHFAPNLWPERPARLRAAWTDYFAAMERLATDLMRVFSLALGLPPTRARFGARIPDRLVSAMPRSRFRHRPRRARTLAPHPFAGPRAVFDNAASPSSPSRTS